jgi:hypothetical protein
LHVLQFDATTNKIIGEAKPETSFDKEKGLLCFKTSSLSRYGGISRKIASGAAPQMGAAVDTGVPTAAIVGGVMGGLLLLTGCTFIFWYTERNRQKEMAAHVRMLASLTLKPCLCPFCVHAIDSGSRHATPLSTSGPGVSSELICKLADGLSSSGGIPNALFACTHVCFL